MNNMLDYISLLYWNVRGLGQPVKRGKVFAHNEIRQFSYKKRMLKPLSTGNSGLTGSHRSIIFLSINQSIKFYLYSPYSQITVCLTGCDILCP